MKSVIGELATMLAECGAVAGLMVGCGGQTLDVGNDQVAEGGTSTKNRSLAEEMGANPICNAPVVDAPNANWPDPVACAAAAAGVQSLAVGLWEGYAEDQYFVPDLKKKYHIEILAASPGGPVCGTVRVNDGPVPELSDDPTAMYPPLDSTFYASNDISLEGSANPSGLLDGFTYSIITGGMAESEIRFNLSGYEHLKGWCGLQTAYKTTPWIAARYGCTPGGETGVVTDWSTNTCKLSVAGIERTISFAQCRYCALGGAYACACDSCHCTASVDALIAFDLTFSGDQALGPWGNRGGQLRLKRVSQ